MMAMRAETSSVQRRVRPHAGRPEPTRPRLGDGPGNEAEFIGGADLGGRHPDNTDNEPATEVEVGKAFDANDAELPSEEQMGILLADVDPNDVVRRRNLAQMVDEAA